MNILVTGGLGFIGHNVVQMLQEQGHTVTVVDNRTNYGIISDAEIDHLMEQRLAKIAPDTCVQKIDIIDRLGLRWLFDTKNFDVVVHLASFPRQKVVNADPAAGSRVMSEGLLNLLDLSANYSVKKFVYISSSMVYGDFSDNVTEDAGCAPQGEYGIMKLAGEWLVKDYSRRDLFTHVIIRPSAVYGPYDVEDRVVAKFLTCAMRGQELKVNGSTEQLDFTYVTDTAKGIVQATLSDKTDNKTYNITRGRSRSLGDAAKLAVNIAGSGSITTNPRDMSFPSRGALNCDAAYKDFGFVPKVDIEQGFQLYYEWLKNDSFFGHSKTV